MEKDESARITMSKYNVTASSAYTAVAIFIGHPPWL